MNRDDRAQGAEGGGAARRRLSDEKKCVCKCMTEIVIMSDKIKVVISTDRKEDELFTGWRIYSTCQLT